MFILGDSTVVAMFWFFTVCRNRHVGSCKKPRRERSEEILQKDLPDGLTWILCFATSKGSPAARRGCRIGVGWEIIMFSTPAFRRMLLVGVGCAQQVVGIDATILSSGCSRRLASNQTSKAFSHLSWNSQANLHCRRW
jgi:hypothetical protein